MKLNFDPLKDLQPIGLIVIVPNVLLSNLGVPVSSVADLVRQMKAKPESIRYASSGVGSTQHLAGEAFDLLAGTRSIHIPYKGSSQAHLDLRRQRADRSTTSSSIGQDQGRQAASLAAVFEIK
jgi:tripartite-type tricarboxylate transporter receptor subunit TctC